MTQPEPTRQASYLPGEGEPAEGKFIQEPYGKRFEIRPDPSDKVPLIISWGYDTSEPDRMWTVTVDYNDGEAAGDLFRFADEWHSHMWFGYLCYSMEHEAITRRRQPVMTAIPIPPAVAQMFGRQLKMGETPAEADNVGGERTGQYL